MFQWVNAPPLTGLGFSQGMGLAHHPAQVVPGHMGVDLGGGDIGMAQKRLHAAQIRAAFHQMGGEGMAQHMRRNFGGIDARPSAPGLQQLMKAPAGEKAVLAARAEEIAVVLVALWARNSARTSR